MKTKILKNEQELGNNAAFTGSQMIKKAIEENGQAHVILATGASQFEVLKNLLLQPGVDWSKVVVFHLDEYVGLPASHRASFRKYLLDRFIHEVPALHTYHLIDGENPDPAGECARVGEILARHPVDVAFVGIGVNGHLAFNDPPADFITDVPYMVVELDEVCRKQQLDEGWFDTLAEVPQRAVSMSIKQILKSKSIVCSVPGLRKAEAVRNCLENDVTNEFPSSILQNHSQCYLYLDQDSASLLSEDYIRKEFKS